MQYSSQFKNIHNTQINHSFTPLQQLSLYDYKCGIYQGEYFKNHRQGKGVFYWYSGQIYIGEWMNDTIEGQGTLYFPYGGNFVGFFSNNKAQGAGILTLLDGSRIAGNWKQGRIDGNFVRYDSESDRWILLNSQSYYNINKQSSNYSYAIGYSQQQNTSYQKQINQLYESIKSKIDTPYYKQMTERLEGHNLQSSAVYAQPNQFQNQQQNQISSSNLFNQVTVAEVDKFKIKLQQLDDEIFYHGIIRGSRPDGMGIMFSMNGRFSARGKFANTKLNGAGRVELENGEIYDGIFRNGIISSGFYYSAKFNSYISGVFRGEGDVKLDFKGKGYPYKLALENKIRVYPCMMIYKNTSEELVFLVQNDIKLLKMLDISKYILTNGENSNQQSDQKLNSANTFGCENTIEESIDYSMRQSQLKEHTILEDEREYENYQNVITLPYKQSVSNKQSDKIMNNKNFDDAFEEFILTQQLDPRQCKLISEDYYSRQFDIEEDSIEDYYQNRNLANINYNANSNFSSSEHDKEYVKKLLLHKINVEGFKDLCYDDLQRLNQYSQDIDKENQQTPSEKHSKLTASQNFIMKKYLKVAQEKADYYLNKARFLKLKLKLKEETKNEQRDDEERSYRQSSFPQIQSQLQNYTNYINNNSEHKNDFSPEFVQTVDQNNKTYSIAVPQRVNKSDSRNNEQNAHQKQLYQYQMDSYLDTSQEYNQQNKESQQSNTDQLNSSPDQNSSSNNHMKFSFKKNSKDSKGLSSNLASLQNQMMHPSKDIQNYTDGLLSQDINQQFKRFEEKFLTNDDSNQSSKQMYFNQKYNNIYN